MGPALGATHRQRRLTVALSPTQCLAINAIIQFQEMTKERHAQRLAAQRLYRERHKTRLNAEVRERRAREKLSRPIPPQPTSKMCSACLMEKALCAFSKLKRVTGVRPSRGAYGHTNVCKSCKSQRRKPTLASERYERAELKDAGLKRCGTCHTTQPLTNFNVRRASPDGLCHKCRSCSNIDSAKWAKAHPDAHAKWYAEHREHKRQYWSQWRRDNATHVQQNYRRWASANRDKVNALIAKRQAMKLRATPRWADINAIATFYEEAARLTRETGVRHEVDHIVPIRSRIVCGLHVEHNLQILTSIENKTKSNHHEAAFSITPASAAFLKTSARNCSTLSADSDLAGNGSGAVGGRVGSCLSDNSASGQFCSCK